MGNTIEKMRNRIKDPAMMPTKTHAAKEGRTVLENWENLLFLTKEPNRHGTIVWTVRLIFGDLHTFRYGPFETVDEATTAFLAVSKYLDSELEGCAYEAANQAGWIPVNEEL